MRLIEILRELTKFYSIKSKSEEETLKVLETYKEIILGETYKTSKVYDWDKLYKTILTKWQYKTYPSIPDILQYLPECEKAKEIIECENEGELIVLELSNGNTYQFTVSNLGRSLKDLKANLNEKGIGYKINRYPKGTVIIGNKVFTN